MSTIVFDRKNAAPSLKARCFPTSDLDVYCFLKCHLPAPYRIEAHPKTEYFSEWKYCYRLFREDELIAQWEGEFVMGQNGSLIAKALRIVQEYQIDFNRLRHGTPVVSQQGDILP